MSLMKEIRGKKNNKQTMPDCVDGETAPNLILDKFKDVYQQLYNSAETSPAMREIKQQLKVLIGETDSLIEVNKITSNIV